jgi:hypothetical protein
VEERRLIYNTRSRRYRRGGKLMVLLLIDREREREIGGKGSCEGNGWGIYRQGWDEFGGERWGMSWMESVLCYSVERE